MYTVAISTLHGKIISLPVEPDTMVSAFKQRCLDACPDESPLAVNADWAEVMVHSLNIWGEGVRLALLDGTFLQDAQSIALSVCAHALFAVNDFCCRLPGDKCIASDSRTGVVARATMRVEAVGRTYPTRHLLGTTCKQKQSVEKLREGQWWVT